MQNFIFDLSPNFLFIALFFFVKFIFDFELNISVHRIIIFFCKMSVRHSGDNLPHSQSLCTICRESFSDQDEVLVTACRHRFHKQCLLDWLKRKPSCPQCRAACTARDFSMQANTNRPQTRSVAASMPAQNAANVANLETDPNLNQANAQNNTSEQPSTSQAAQEQARQRNSPQQNNNGEEQRIRNIVSAILQARQTTMFENFETRVAQMISNSIESSVNQIVARVQGQNQLPPAPVQDRLTNDTYNIPDNLFHNLPTQPNSPVNNSNRSRSNFTTATQASRLAQLISSWDIKFDGTSKLSVDNFIYRIEYQVQDALGYDFNLLCEHVHSLFAGEARDWYWRYRRSVDRIVWSDLCDALRTAFAEYRTDSEIKNSMRARKQGPNESFDEYKSAVLRISESLQDPCSERELCEILMSGVKPRIRQQIVYFPIRTVSELRRYCLKGEYYLQEINRGTLNNNFNAPQNNFNANRAQVPRRQISEINEDLGFEVVEPEQAEILEVNRPAANNSNLNVCWNCRLEGHRYSECLETRTVFCYGCGAPNTYKPHCKKCSENPKTSEGSKKNLRKD